MTSPVSPPTMTGAPTAPDRSDRATFSARATAWADFQKDTLVPEIQDAIDNAFTNATSAHESAVAADVSEAAAAASESASAGNAAAAAASAGAAMWVSGSYTEGQAARSPANSRVYIARTTGSKPTDPASDSTNWRIASSGSLPDWPYSGTTASPPLGERSRFTNAAAVAVTVPLPAGAGEEWAGLWENGLYTNTFDIGVATLKHNGVTLTGVITNNKRIPIHLVSVGANNWRFAS